MCFQQFFIYVIYWLNGFGCRMKGFRDMNCFFKNTFFSTAKFFLLIFLGFNFSCAPSGKESLPRLESLKRNESAQRIHSTSDLNQGELENRIQERIDSIVRIETDSGQSLMGSQKEVLKGQSIPENSIEWRGTVTPTVYYLASTDESKETCHDRERRALIDKKGKVLIRICPRISKECHLQGSCRIIQNGVARVFNVSERLQGVTRFFEVDVKGCRFGYGVISSCLDPFYTLAADLKMYSPGDVIYVPGLVGLKLPQGQNHDGYFVIRDRGAAIKGRGRFDFFSGEWSWSHPENPFRKVGLVDKKNRIPYYKVKEPLAKKIREKRGYPHLPQL